MNPRLHARFEAKINAAFSKEVYADGEQMQFRLDSIATPHCYITTTLTNQQFGNGGGICGKTPQIKQWLLLL